MGRDVANECDVRDEANDLYNLSEDPRIEFIHYTFNNLSFTLKQILCSFYSFYLILYNTQYQNNILGFREQAENLKN